MEIYKLGGKKYINSTFFFYLIFFIVHKKTDKNNVKNAVCGAKPSTVDAWQCFFFNIRDHIKE